MAITCPVPAHEFWIDPSTHYTETPERVDIRLLVGERFRGSTQPYLPQRFERFEQISTTMEPIAGLLGDSSPAARIESRPGLNRLVHLTTPRVLRFAAGEDRWDRYVELDGLAGQLARFPAMPLAPPLTERYVRSAKSLVVTGTSPVADALTGRLPFELVIDGSWVRLRPGEHRFTLYEGETGLPGILVKAFRKSDREVVDRAYTDSQGRVTLTLPSADRYLVSGVVIRPDSHPDYDWFSHWPSLTLELR